MSVRREDLTPEYVARAIRRMKADGYFQPLSDEQRADSLRHILAERPAGGDLWVFGYGSLMWNPMVYHQEQRHGLLHGYHRRYCFWTRSGRSSPETPGLGLGLDRGGSCRGMAFRIAAHQVEGEMELLWRREMISGVYLPRWVNVHTPQGTVRAVTFVADRSHSRYCGKLPPGKIAGHIARAQGWRGSARSYLENTVTKLAELGFRDPYLSRLHALVLAERAQ
jgi:cation transport protein ChaC